MNIENIRRVLNQQAGKDLLKYLTAELESMKNIDELEISLNPIKTTIELKAQKKAYNKLKQILVGLITYSEDQQAKSNQDSYQV